MNADMQELIGKNLGQYKIDREIGRGGMGVVFKAYQPGLNRWVAIKILPPQYANTPQLRERFLREARVIAQLEHPHILPVYDFGQQDHYIYLVMRYIEDSCTLIAVMNRRLTLPEMATYLQPVAAALDYAHRRGIIHRDVKPGNILLDQDQRVLLADFGLARSIETDEHLTRTGSGIGSPAYMSPEQGAGKAVDHRTDIYALGVIAYQMLTGQIPHRAETPQQIIIKRNSEPPPPLRRYNPDISPDIEWVVQKALSQTPEARYASAGAFVTALQQAFTGATQVGGLPATTPDDSVSRISTARCSHCGQPVTPQMAFCGYCGQAVNIATSPLPAPQAPGPRRRAVRRSKRPALWGSFAFIIIIVFVAGMLLGMVEVIGAAVVALVVLGGIFLYQNYDDWFG